MMKKKLERRLLLWLIDFSHHLCTERTREFARWLRSLTDKVWHLLRKEIQLMGWVSRRSLKSNSKIFIRIDLLPRKSSKGISSFLDSWQNLKFRARKNRKIKPFLQMRTMIFKLSLKRIRESHCPLCTLISRSRLRKGKAGSVSLRLQHTRMEIGPGRLLN
jgi:hypothetical protein